MLRGYLSRSDSSSGGEQSARPSVRPASASTAGSRSRAPAARSAAPGGCAASARSPPWRRPRRSARAPDRLARRREGRKSSPGCCPRASRTAPRCRRPAGSRRPAAGGSARPGPPAAENTASRLQPCEVQPHPSAGRQAVGKAAQPGDVDLLDVRAPGGTQQLQPLRQFAPRFPRRAPASRCPAVPRGRSPAPRSARPAGRSDHGRGGRRAIPPGAALRCCRSWDRSPEEATCLY